MLTKKIFEHLKDFSFYSDCVNDKKGLYLLYSHPLK